MFRGIQFGTSLEEVKGKENLNPDIEYGDYLHYYLNADSIAEGESVDIEYFFNRNDQLDMVIAFYNLTDKETIHPLADELYRYLERKYGRPRQDELGWYHWDFEEKNNESGTIEINLVGETEPGYMGVEIEFIKYFENEERVR